MATLDDELRSLWERRKPRTLAGIAVVEAAASPDAERGPDGDLTADQARAARAEAHKLAGSIGMFGFTEASALAQRLDDVVVAGAFAHAGGRRQVLELAHRLRHALDTVD